MTKRIGIALGRSGCVLCVLERRFISYSREFKRPENVQVAVWLREVIDQLPAEYRIGEVGIGISPALLAASDSFEIPGKTPSQAEAIFCSLVEGRCAGETLEEMVHDLRARRATGGCRVQAVAIRRSIFEEILGVVQSALPQSKIKMISAAPCLLSNLLESAKPDLTIGLACQGDCYLIGPTGWRCFPAHPDPEQAKKQIFAAIPVPGGTSAPPEFGPSKILSEGEALVLAEDLNVPSAQAVAVSAAIARGEGIPNLLLGAGHASGSSSIRLFRPLGRLGAAAAVLFLVAACLFHGRAETARGRLEEALFLEQRAWKEILPGRSYQAGMLENACKEVVTQHQRSIEVNRVPSALAFWGQVGAALPDPDRIGFTLESLQLGSNDGRLTAKVEAPSGDPLLNAALLERALNAVEVLSARGEYETKERETLVRLRLEYRPRGGSLVREPAR